MDILNCFEDPETVYLYCSLTNHYSTFCICEKHILNDSPSFLLNNTDLYATLNAHEINENNTIEIWNNSHPIRVDDCMKLRGVFDWGCVTKPRNFTLTRCACRTYDLDPYSAVGYIESKSLFKGLENFTFSFAHQNYYNINQINLSDFERDNSNRYIECDQEQNSIDTSRLKNSISLDFSVIYISLSILFAFFCLIFIFGILSRKLQTKNFKTQNKSMLEKLLSDF